MKSPAITHGSLRVKSVVIPFWLSPVVYESKSTSAASAAEPIA